MYALDADELASLRPDLIVTQSLCDVCAVDEEQVRTVAGSFKKQPTIVNLSPMSLQGVFAGIQQVGDAAGCSQRATETVTALQRRVQRVEQQVRNSPQRPRVIMLEWLEPLFCAGHWNPELVSLAGGVELLGEAGQKSRRIEWHQIVRADPDALVIACCGYDRKRALEDLPILQQQPEWHQLQSVRTDRVWVLDGSAYFNRPGPRLVDALELLAEHFLPFQLDQPSARNSAAP